MGHRAGRRDSVKEFTAELNRRLDEIRRQGLYRELRRVDSPQSPRVRLDGQSLLNFSSNDYLGLANHPLLKEAAVKAVEQFGSGSGASRLICGSLAPHHELEAALAEFKQTGSALSFSSGYTAAVGTICALAGKDDVLVLDKLVHACVIDAARLSGAKLRIFAHNDLNELEDILRWFSQRPAGENARRSRAIIVTESVFSMDGDLAPLREIVALKEKYDAWLMVDEAHATGFFGPGRRGLADELGVSDRIEIQMGTLGKALGSAGGYICGPRALTDYLVNRARSFIFSTAPVPAAAAAARAAVQLVQSVEGAAPPRSTLVAGRSVESRPRAPRLGPLQCQQRHHPTDHRFGNHGQGSGCGAARSRHFHPRHPLSNCCARAGEAAIDPHRRAYRRRCDRPAGRAGRKSSPCISSRVLITNTSGIHSRKCSIGCGANRLSLPPDAARFCVMFTVTNISTPILSIWTNLHGHAHPKINAAIRRQLDKIAHSSALGFANEPASLLAERLVKAAKLSSVSRKRNHSVLFPSPIPHSALRTPNLTKVFFSDDGSTALEVALKLAFIFARRSGATPGQNSFRWMARITATPSAPSASATLTSFTRRIPACSSEPISVMAPYCYRCPFNRARPDRADARDYRKCNHECIGLVEIKFAAAKRKGNPYAMFVRTGDAGRRRDDSPARAAGCRRAAEIARGHGAQLIADEVMTGFGRTGSAAACLPAIRRVSSRIFLQPLAKGLTGGYLPMAATLTTPAVFEAFLGDYAEFKTFFHGHSFTGNQLGAAAALASLDLLQSPASLRGRQKLQRVLREELQSLWALPNVGDIRQAGLVAGVELVRDWRTRRPFDLREQAGIRVCEAMARRGVLSRPVGNVIVLMPPYCTTPAQAARIIRALFRIHQETLLGTV